MAPATSATTSDFATRLESASIGFDAASSGLAANGGGGVQAERAGEDSETMQDHAFGLGKQAIAPIERRPQRLMPRQRCPPTARQQVEEIVETNSQFLDAERGGPRRRQEAMAAVAERSHSDILPDPPLAPDAGFVTMPSAPFEASSAKSEASRRPSSGELLNFSSHQQPSFNALFTILA